MEGDTEMAELEDVIINFESVDLHPSPSPTIPTVSSSYPSSSARNSSKSKANTAIENVFKFRRSLEFPHVRGNRSQERSYRISDGNITDAQNDKTLPAIGRLRSESKLASMELRGEREMYLKLGLSRSCDDLRSLKTGPENDGAGDSAVVESEADITLPSPEAVMPTCFQMPKSADIIIGTPEKNGSDSRKSSMDYEHCLSPVGFFMNSTPTSPVGPMGRPRSGSQSPYRRTYNSHSTVNLRQTLLGKRRADDRDSGDDSSGDTSKRPRSSTVSMV